MLKLDDLLFALDFVSAGAPLGNEAYLCKESGAVYLHSELGDNEEELPDDIGSDKYIVIPHKNDLDLGKKLVLRFTAEFLPDEFDRVSDIFRRRGAYGRFKDLLERSGKLHQWYDYEAGAQKRALLEWCELNGIEVDDPAEAAITDTIQRWHRIVETRDLARLDELLADDATFHSPVVHTPQVGKTITRLYLHAAFAVLFNESFRYVRELVTDHDAVLEFIVEIEGIAVNGVDMIRWNDDGKIVDFKVMLRPLKAVNLIHQKMAVMLQSPRS